MGLFGKDEKLKEGSTSKDTTSVDLKPTESPVVQAVAPQSELKETLCGWYKSGKSSWREARSKSCQWTHSPEMKEMNRKRKEFVGQFCHPMGHFYRDFPDDLTTAKYSAFGEYSYRQRLFGLEGLVLFTAISTLRIRSNKLGFTKRFMFAIRNSTVVFLLGGLLVAPEIYNPLIKSDF